MKKPAPRNEPGAAEAKGKSKHSNTAPLSLPLIAPQDNLRQLGHLRREYDRWHAKGCVGRLPQPSDFGLRLGSLSSTEVLRRAK